MNESDNCIFCKIIRGELPCQKVYEDDYTLAFLTIQPRAEGHTLVVPKQHCRNIVDCPLEVLSHVMATVKRIAKEHVELYGFTQIVQNNEKPVKEVFHLHFHVVPYNHK